MRFLKQLKEWVTMGAVVTIGATAGLLLTAFSSESCAPANKKAKTKAPVVQTVDAGAATEAESAPDATPRLAKKRLDSGEVEAGQPLPRNYME